MFESIGSHLIAIVLWVLIAAVAGAFLVRAKSSRPFQDWRCQRALRRLFDFPKNQPVLIVLPEWETKKETTGQVSLFAFEDMVAASLVDRSLILAGWPENNVSIISTQRIARDHTKLRNNLVVLCSPHRNQVTDQVLKGLNETNRLVYPFVKLSADKPFHLTLGGQSFFSDSYRESEQLQREYPGHNPYEVGTLHDCALIARCVNPLNPNAKVLVLAGIRAFGTWGAAHALREECAKLYALTKKKKEFAVIVKCEFAAFKITKCSFEYHVTNNS